MDSDAVREPTRTWYLIRHPETDWNRDGRFQSSSRPLTPTGEQTVACAVAYFRHARLDRIYSSDLSQAQSLAVAVARVQHPAVEPVLDLRLREISHGTWEGRTPEEVRASDPGALHARFADVLASTVHNGESLAMIAERVRDFFQEVSQAHAVNAPSDTVMVVTHATPIQLMLCFALDCPILRYGSFAVGTGSMTILSQYGQTFVLDRTNSDALVTPGLRETNGRRNDEK